MFDRPYISICIPIYKVASFIDRCACSIFEQSYQDWEAIFVDDCSPDDSVLRLEQVLLEYPNCKDKVRIIHHSKNRGLAAARNTGVAAAKGEFIMHVDSDDWLETTALETLVKKQLDTGADIVSGNAIAEYEDHEDYLSEPEYSNKEEMMRQMIEMNINHVLWRRIIRKSLYTENDIAAVEGLDIGEDHYTLPRLIYYAHRCDYVNSVVYHYNCVNDNSYMQTNTYEKQLVRYNSDLVSINVLIDFFSGLDLVCVRRLKEIKANRLYRFAHFYYDSGDGKNYNRYMRELYSMGTFYIDYVGIKGVLRRFIYGNYNRFYLYLNFRGVKQM